MAPTQEWMGEVNAWSPVRRRLRTRIRSGAVHDDRVYDVDTYIWNVLIAIDQLGNALTAGDPDETISSRIGKAKLKGDMNLVQAALDAMLDVIDPNHSIDAIEFDEGERISGDLATQPA